MYSQLQKLAIICNACFWSTVIFQVWEMARKIPEQVRNTIVVLGISALIVNLVTILLSRFYFQKLADAQPMKGWIRWLIGVSTVCQLAWLGYNVFYS